jgi:hypothetical protein
VAQVVAGDFPYVSEVLLEFSDRWVLSDYLGGDPPLYIGRWTQEEQVRFHRFYHLPRQVNENLNHYTLYKFFRPWLLPSLLVAWDETTGRGRVIKPKDIKIRMQPLGQAQVWHGDAYAVVWECYFFSSGREYPNWQGRLSQIWQGVEKDIKARVFYTLPHEPDWPGGKAGYREFLGHLGYVPSQESQGWWSKGVFRGSEAKF